MDRWRNVSGAGAARAPSGAYVRRAGDDVQPGDVAVRAGTIIGAAQVGLLAAVGRERVLVHPRPRLSVMAVGGELVDISRTPGNGQVYDVNSYALAAAGRDACAEVNRVGIVSNDPTELGEIVEGQLNRAEVVVIAGGVGGAAAEAVRSVLSELGEMEVVRVAMHPGSVQGFGQLGRDGVPTFLLPANPVSALVVFEVMVRPLIRLSLGKRHPMRRIVSARTLSPITSVAGRKGYLRGQLMRDQDSGEYLVQALGGAPGRHRTCSRRLPKRTVWLWFPPGPSRFARVRSWMSPSWLSTAEPNHGDSGELMALESPASGMADGRRAAAGLGRRDSAAAGADA